MIHKSCGQKTDRIVIVVSFNSVSRVHIKAVPGLVHLFSTADADASSNLIFREFPNSAALWIGILTIFASIFLMHYKIPLYSEAKRLRSN